MHDTADRGALSRSPGHEAGPFGINKTGSWGGGDGRVPWVRGAAVGSRLMPATCVFCAIIRGEQQAVTILETERLIAFLDHRPLF